MGNTFCSMKSTLSDYLAGAVSSTGTYGLSTVTGAESTVEFTTGATTGSEDAPCTGSFSVFEVPTVGGSFSPSMESGEQDTTDNDNINAIQNRITRAFLISPFLPTMWKQPFLKCWLYQSHYHEAKMILWKTITVKQNRFHFYLQPLNKYWNMTFFFYT